MRSRLAGSGSVSRSRRRKAMLDKPSQRSVGAREGAVGDIGGGQAADPRREQACEVALRAGQLQRRADRSRGQQLERAVVLSGLVGRVVVPRIRVGEDRLPVGAAVGALGGRIGLRRTRDGRRAGDGRCLRSGALEDGDEDLAVALPGRAAGRQPPRWPLASATFAWLRSPKLRLPPSMAPAEPQRHATPRRRFPYGARPDLRPTARTGAAQRAPTPSASVARAATSRAASGPSSGTRTVPRTRGPSHRRNSAMSTPGGGISGAGRCSSTRVPMTSDRAVGARRARWLQADRARRRR